MSKIRWSPVVVLGTLIICMCIGCSVKERRGECPSVLVLDFSGVDSDKSDSLNVSIRSAGDYLFKDVVTKDLYSQLYKVQVPKGKIFLTSYSVESGGEDFSEMISDDGATLTIPFGSQCPQLNAFSSTAEIWNEMTVIPVVLYKNYCEVKIEMVCETSVQFKLTFIGSVNGYDSEGQPMAGQFSYSPEQYGNGMFKTRIPRQVDNSLRLAIADDEEVLREFAVGEYISESGYDWVAANLENIEIQINYSKTDVTFVVNDWKKEVDLEVII